MNVHEATLVGKRTVVDHIDGIGEGVSQCDSLQIDLELALSHRVILDILLVDFGRDCRNVLAGKRLARYVEGTVAVLGEQFQELDHEIVKVIAGRLDGLCISLGLCVTESGAHRVINEED